jgi:pSer/pThr/pTyr-binding forkhead associated (FHA) protein
MRVVLEIQPGSVAARSVTIAAGSEVRVGRMAPAQVMVSDQTVSRQHFAVAFNGRSCWIRDLGSTHGTLVNGQAATHAVLHDGDLIQAGMTMFRVRFAEEGIEESAIPVVAGPPERTDPDPAGAGTLKLPVLDLTLHDSVIRELRSQKEPLYAILDAARDPVILARLLLDCKEEYQSLYEGDEGVKLAAFAPYLVALPRGSTFLETIVRDGWGKSWGVFLTSDRPFREVRKHLRHFLSVELEQVSRKMFFRFYDPRVLRVFLPTCTPNQVSEFFGPITRYVLEGVEPAIIVEYQNGRSGLGSAARSLEGAVM